MIRLLLLALAVSPLTLLAAVGSALAETPTGKDLRCHVSMHAQTTGFGQGINPGRHHQGFSNWVGSMPC